MKLKDRLSQPGFVLSALVHAGALAATLVAFSANEKFEDQQETVPVEVVTDNQFNQIMKGDKAAKVVRPEARAQAEQVASLEEAKPTPPAPDQTRDVPTPPPPPPPPQAQSQPTPPAPVTPPPPMPPERPEQPAERPQQQDPSPPVPTPPVRDVEGEPMLPKPIPRPTPKPVPPVPTPPVVPHPTVAKVHETHTPPPPPPPKPRPVEKPKVDVMAKLIEQQPPMALVQPTPSPKPSPHKSKPAPEADPDSKFDPTDISKLLSHDAPAQKAATAHDVSHLASLGSPTASSPKMSPSFWAGLDGAMEDQYRQCWSYLGLTQGMKYVPQVRVVYGQDGSLQGQPQLINPPSDPSLQSLADSALRAVRRCNPMKIPEQYAPYYDQWKGRVLRFDPEEMAG